MISTIVRTAIGILLATGAVAADYQVSIAPNGVNEYVASAKGITLVGGSPFQAGPPILNSTYDGCLGTVDQAPIYLQETQDQTMAFGLFQPCGSTAVLVEFGITNHGLYQRYSNNSAIIGGLGNHQPSFQSLAVGPKNSVVMLVATPEDVSDNEALIYNNELELLDIVPGFIDKAGYWQDIVSVTIDPSGLYFYLCTTGGGGDVVTQYAWKAAVNPLLHPQSVLPVPYDQVSQSYDPLVWNAFCQ
jgi:hypothetical protein